MKKFLQKLLTLGLFLLATAFFYLAASTAFSFPLLNIFLFIIAIFVLLLGCGEADKLMGLGKYNDDDEK